MATSSRDKTVIGLLLVTIVLATVVRILTLIAYPPGDPVADAADYQRLAAALVDGRGFVSEDGSASAWRPPGYPFFLAGVYSVTGVSPRAASIANALLGMLTVVLIVLLAWEMFGKSVAIAAGVLGIFHQSFFWLPRVLLSENLNLPLLVAVLLALYKFLTSRDLRWLLLLGPICGLLVLVRGSNLIFVGVMLAGLGVDLIRQRAGLSRTMRAVALVAILMAITVAPWVIRNNYALGEPVLSTQDGMTLYASYYPPESNGKMIWGNLPGVEDPYVAAGYSAGNEIEVSAAMRRTAMDRLYNEPGRVITIIPSKLVSLLAPFDWEWFPHAEGKSRSTNWTYLLLCLAGLFGLVAIWQRPPPHWWVLFILPVATLLQAVVFYC
jgi:4-amino-4-deoxy-L-arabinose transferase-like glycosyltransferase